MFDSLSDRLTSTLENLRSKGRLTEADINATAKDIRVALLEADVALPVVKSFVYRIKERSRGQHVSGALNPAQQVIKIVNEELISILGGESRRLTLAKNPPTIIMLVGLQGAGKTTLAGKLALYLKSQGHTPALIACDLQRPGAVNQLQIVGKNVDVPVFAPHPGVTSESTDASGSELTGDPVAVADEGLAWAKTKHYDVVIIDTAGRLGVDKELMSQAAAIKEAVQPHEVLFVLDSMIGQDAVATAAAFQEGVDFTGVVLTKLDGDSRGGAALSVRELTQRPVLFASTGEKLTDFDVFHPDRMANRILGMGDVLTLIEQAEKIYDEQQAIKAADKMSAGSFDLEDFLEQMLMIRKMGSIGNLLGMMPGAGKMKDAISHVDDKQLDKIQAIIRGMTPQERTDPKIINGSRRLRIAHGSGVSVSDVNNLVDRFFEARKMMVSMMGGSLVGKRISKNKKNKKNKNAKNARHKAVASQPQLPANMPDLSQYSGGLGELPPALQNFDFSSFKLPKK